MAADHLAGDPRTNRERMLAGDLSVADDPENARPAQIVLAAGSPARVVRGISDDGRVRDA
jgi:maltose O-acetyltransferase